MAMTFNDIVIADIMYNGESLDELQINGETVWSSYLEFTLQSDNTYSVTTKNGATVPDNVVIPSNYNGKAITSINSKAFWKCSSLTSVVIPDSVTSIGSYAFYYCSNLTRVVIPDSVTAIGQSTFAYCNSLISVVIPDGIVEIDSMTFEHCSSLTSVVLPKSVNFIDGNAFNDCSNLTSVYYKGDADEWSNITIASVNTNITKATRYYYSATQPTTTGNYWHYVNGVPTPW